METFNSSRKLILTVMSGIIILLTSGNIVAQPSKSLEDACTECEGRLAALEKQVVTLRYIATGKLMALKSTMVSMDSDQRALVAMQAYKFNLQHNGNPTDQDIYQGLYTALMQFKNPVPEGPSLSMQALFDALCKQTTRNMTTEEWHNWVGSDLPYEKTCEK